jgi:hypothetical protein
MRRLLDVLLVVVFCSCVVASVGLAQEVPAEEPGLSLTLPKVIAAVIGLVGLGERVRDWIRRYREHINLTYRVLEEMGHSSAPEIAKAAAIVKLRLKNELADAAKPVKDMALLTAARAERLNGSAATGGATRTLKREAGRVILRTALRLIPGIGRLF